MYLGWISGIRGPSPVSRQALRSIQPLVRWELGALSSREKQAGNKLDHLLPRLQMHEVMSPLPHMPSWCGV